MGDKSDGDLTWDDAIREAKGRIRVHRIRSNELKQAIIYFEKLKAVNFPIPKRKVANDDSDKTT